MKNFLLKTKQWISYVLSLKSKKLTILLGTLVPFFSAHVMASAGKKVKGGKYIHHSYLAFFLFLILYSVEAIGIIACLSPIKKDPLSGPNILLVIILSSMYFLANWSITKLFCLMLFEKKENSLN